MTQPDFMFQHTVLERLDTAIREFESSATELSKSLSERTVKRTEFALSQTRKEIEHVREEAIATIARLNTFGATIESMAMPELGVEQIVGDILNWFLLLTECERAFISLYDKEQEAFVMNISHDWLTGELRPEEQVISEGVLKRVQKTNDLFSSSNMDMASEKYQKSGSWRIPLRVVMGIPLLWNDELIGVFYGDRKIKAGMVPLDMLPLFKLYAVQAAIAIRNAQLFADLTAE